jgi:hypothetical protein
LSKFVVRRRSVPVADIGGTGARPWFGVFGAVGPVEAGALPEGGTVRESWQPKAPNNEIAPINDTIRAGEKISGTATAVDILTVDIAFTIHIGVNGCGNADSDTTLGAA